MLNKKLETYRIILASKSPRRKLLLKGLDIDFEIIVKDNIDESYPLGMSPEKIPEFLAEKKSMSYEISENDLLITADTIVLLDNEVIGKPKDRQNAFDILSKLSGKTHLVVTGMCLRSIEKKSSFSVNTEVTFKSLSDNEINYYLDRYKPYDKAGSYGVQEWIGYVGISNINGSYYNVVGLPVGELYDELLNF